jgi:hypothetical protein
MAVKRHLLLVGLVLVAAASQSPAATIYDFEGLNSGQDLIGQDGWVIKSTSWTGDIDVASGSGVNTSQVARGSGTVSGGALRVNDASYSFPSFQGNETNVFMQADVRLGTSSIRTAMFGLGHDVNGDDYIGTGPPELGPRFGVGYQDYGTDSFVVRAADNTITTRSIATANGGASAGSSTDWFQVRLLMDFTADAGDGSGSLFYRNLTAGDTSFSPVTGLQNVDLNLASTETDPTTWDTLYIRLHDGSQIDNLDPTSVPEPSSMLLVASGAAAFLLSRVLRRKVYRAKAP